MLTGATRPTVVNRVPPCASASGYQSTLWIVSSCAVGSTFAALPPHTSRMSPHAAVYGESGVVLLASVPSTVAGRCSSSALHAAAASPVGEGGVRETEESLLHATRARTTAMSAVARPVVRRTVPLRGGRRDR